jgi:hypothetical protein
VVWWNTAEPYGGVGSIEPPEARGLSRDEVRLVTLYGPGGIGSNPATQNIVTVYAMVDDLNKYLSKANELGAKNLVYADPGCAEQLFRQAARIAINRHVAGVHFPVDSVAGTVLGLALGNYAVSRCDGVTPTHEWGFDGGAYPHDLDYDWRMDRPSSFPVTPHAAVKPSRRTLHAELLRLCARIGYDPALPAQRDRSRSGVDRDPGRCRDGRGHWGCRPARSRRRSG